MHFLRYKLSVKSVFQNIKNNNTFRNFYKYINLERLYYPNFPSRFSEKNKIGKKNVNVFKSFTINLIILRNMIVFKI